MKKIVIFVIVILGLATTAFGIGKYNGEGCSYKDGQNWKADNNNHGSDWYKVHWANNPLRDDVNNYEAWKSKAYEKEVSQSYLNKIDKENFELFVEYYEARESGDYEKASEIKMKLIPEGRHFNQKKYKHWK